jgi:hypothetical protein
MKKNPELFQPNVLINFFPEFYFYERNLFCQQSIKQFY